VSREEDEAAIGAGMMALGQAFRELDAGHLDGVYAADADWTNAFGTTLKGADTIAAYLTKLFADPNFAAGKPLGPPQAEMRFVTDDVAIVKTYLERAGQKTVDGGTLPVRRNHSIKVFARQDEGWHVVSDLYMDARDEQTMAG
jgi:uncharacterized protein (TIGR02246 family)